MNPEIKRLWIEALRSGEYLQVNGALRRKEDEKDMFCCLGVLCDLYTKQSEDKWDNEEHVFPTILGSTTYLPVRVMEWAGLNEANPRVKKEGTSLPYDMTSLAHLNDMHKPFEYIAQIIEEQL